MKIKKIGCCRTADFFTKSEKGFDNETIILLVKSFEQHHDH